MARKNWYVVLRPNGIVEHVDGGAPSTWVGHELASNPAAPKAVRKAARVLLDRGEDAFGATTVCLADVDTDVVLVVASGIPLRSTLTRVDDVAARVLDAFSTQASGAGVTLTVSTSPRVPPAFLLDREKIVWVIATLVGNALRYVTQREGVAPEVRVELDSDEAPGAPLVVRVRDNGPGMDGATARWLFDRDPKTGRSAGVALLMVADVVAAHRGTVTVGPGREGGTVFTLRLPDRRVRVRAATG